MAQFRPKKVTQEYLQYSKRFFELYQVFINNFLYQTLLIFPLYILLTRNCSYFDLEVSTQFWTWKLHKKNWQVFMYNFLCQSIRILFTRRISNIYKYFLNYIRFSYIIFVSKWLHISFNQKMALFLFFFLHILACTNTTILEVMLQALIIFWSLFYMLCVVYIYYTKP